MTRSSAPGAPNADVTKGPLVGDGRTHRVLPFAVTATISIGVAAPTMSWIRPGYAVAGLTLATGAIIAALAFPWHRVSRNAQLTVPFLFLIATLLLTHATGSVIGSPFVTLAILPLMWLSIYESRHAVLVAATIAGAGLLLASPGGADQPSASPMVATVVFVVCGAGMGVTLHGLVADARRLARSLRDHQLRLERAATMMDALPERVVRYRLSDHEITYCNAAWAAQYDVEPAQAVGRPLKEFLSDDGLEGLTSQLALLGPDNPILVDTAARALPNSPGRWLEWVDQYMADADGAQVLAVGRDVTARREVELRLAESEAGFRDLADKSADVVWRFIVEPTPHLDYISPSVENILGYPQSYFLEDFTRLLDILDDASSTAIMRALKGKQTLDHIDFRFRHANGSIVVGETRTAAIRGGLQGVSRDVTKLRQLQEKMAALALRDPLTGLANRRLLNESLDAALERTKRCGRPLAIAYLDLDGFKHVNDTNGHDAGDVVLRETAQRLLATVRGADVVARVGGDEFAIAYEPDDASSHELIRRLERALSEPIYITPSIAVWCPASIGVADTRTVGYDSAALLAAADEAMYEVKRARQCARDVAQLTFG